VPLVVHVESVVNGMILEIGHIPGNVNGSHSWQSLLAVDEKAAGRAARRDRPSGTAIRQRSCGRR